MAEIDWTALDRHKSSSRRLLPAETASKDASQVYTKSRPRWLSAAAPPSRGVHTFRRICVCVLSHTYPRGRCQVHACNRLDGRSLYLTKRGCGQPRCESRSEARRLVYADQVEPTGPRGSRALRGSRWNHCYTTWSTRERFQAIYATRSEAPGTHCF